MPRFLHVADVHLGFNKYRQENPSRSLDFFYAFKDCIDRYALQENVAFVLIAGDLFEERLIPPGVLSQAEIVLESLKVAGIPVLAIEGNHDNCPYGVKTNWLRYLCEKDYLYLLEPDEKGRLAPWDPEERRGGYIDLPCGVRVIGSQWYGASAPQAIEALARQIQGLPPPPPEGTIMLFHHGLEGQIARYQGALRYSHLLPLREAGVDYLALGHIHRFYTVENWIFNPGSVEANSIAENQEQTPRGVLLATLENRQATAELKRDYWQRPIHRYRLQLTPNDTTARVKERLIALVQEQQAAFADAIVEVRLEGTVGFDRSDLELRSLQQQLQQQSGAFILRLVFAASPLDYQSYQGELVDIPQRTAIEQRVFADLLASVAEYREQAEPLAQELMHLKAQLLDGSSSIEELYEHIGRIIDSQS